MNRRALFIALYLAPALLFYGLFVCIPVFQSFSFATYRWRGISSHVTYVGTENYSRLIGDPVFHKVLVNSLYMLGVGGLAIVGISLLIAHAMQGRGRLAQFMRSIYLFPQVISLVAVALLWQFIFNPAYGLLNGLLSLFGLQRLTHAWLGEPGTAMPCVLVAFCWYAVGFYIMLFSAGIRAIGQEIGESAMLDGASGFRRFMKVTWPMLWVTRRTAVVYLLINVMNVFALVFIMTNGGPDRATEMPLTYLYEIAMKNYEFGEATALAVLYFVLIMAVSLFILWLFRKNPETSSGPVAS